MYLARDEDGPRAYGDGRRTDGWDLTRARRTGGERMLMRWLGDVGVMVISIE